MKNTEKNLDCAVCNLNHIAFGHFCIGYDYDPKVGRGRWIEGVFCLEHTGSGWSVNRVANESGATTTLYGPCSAAECMAWLKEIGRAHV